MQVLQQQKIKGLHTLTYDVKGLNQFIDGASYTTTNGCLTGTLVASNINGSLGNINNVPGMIIYLMTSTPINFTMTSPQIHSANLLNALQISESTSKGDILGDCTVPLNFWYCKSPGLAIPLCALHKSVDVELYIAICLIIRCQLDKRT